MRPAWRATAALAAALALVAGCGGGSDDAATPGATTATAVGPPTTPSPTAPPASAEAPQPAPLGEELLPPLDAVPGVQPAAARTIVDAPDLVDALYRAGDAAKPAAVERLDEGGFDGAILRDQLGTDPTDGVALLRAYVLRMADDEAARAEVADAVAEVRSTSPGAEELDLSDMPGAEGLAVGVDQDGLTGAVVFVTFPSGRYVHGIQAIATAAGALPRDAVVAAARDLYETVNAAP